MRIAGRTEEIPANPEGVGNKRDNLNCPAIEQIRKIVRQMVGDGDRHQREHEESGDLRDRALCCPTHCLVSHENPEIDQEEHDREKNEHDGPEHVPGRSKPNSCKLEEQGMEPGLHRESMPDNATQSGVSLNPSKVTVDSIKKHERRSSRGWHGRSTIKSPA